MSLLTDRNTYDFVKDTVYRFMKMLQINWIRFAILLSNRIMMVTKEQLGINAAGLHWKRESGSDGTLKQAKNADIPAKYLLFDRWFSFPSSFYVVKEIGYDVIRMVKKIPKMFFWYDGGAISLISIYNITKKRRGRSRYFLLVMVDVVKDGKTIPAKVVYVRNSNKRREYLCIISINVSLDENEIIRIYEKC